MLYYFRTPPSVRVGRAPLDAEAMRLLEEHNPDVTFDWPRLLRSGAGSLPSATSGSSVPSGSSGSREDRREDRRRDRRRGRGSEFTPAPAAPPAAAQVTPAADPATEYTQDSEFDAEESAQSVEPGEAEGLEGHEQSQGLEGAGEPDEPGEHGMPAPAAVESRYVRLGADGLARLRARYADIKARIQSRPPDGSDPEELLAQVERLNPDAWLSEEEVAHALEAYETVFEALRPLVGRQSRPRRL